MAEAFAVEVLPASGAAVDAELDAFFAACPTSFAQQTPGWRNVITSIDSDEPVFLGCRRRGQLVGVLPAYRFAGPLGAILTSVPQAGALGGVAVLPETDPEPVYAALLSAFIAESARRGCVLASVITNPFWPDRALYERHLQPDYVLENACQALDLEASLDAAGNPAAGSPHLRRHLRKAESGALAIDEEQSPANVEEWYGIHHARHREIGATPLPKAMFTSALEHMVSRDKARFFFVRLAGSGEMAGGGFYVYHGAVIDALMPAVRSDCMRLAANYLLGLHTIRWARARGLRFYNWQASPPDSGVHRYKRQWGSRDVPYCYLTRITGDHGPIVRSTVEVVGAAYRWHYVLPYDRIGTDPSTARSASSRAAAWNALAAGTRARAADDLAELKRTVVEHYEAQLRRHGATARGMDWKDEASQRLRFAVLCGVADLTGRSVHEVGAGGGHLYDFLEERRIACRYSGSDLSPAMVEAARHRHPDVPFERRDILLEAPGERYDVVVCSGLFHVRRDNDEEVWRSFVRRMIRRMYEMCRVAIAFNLLSDQVDYRAPGLHYECPGDVLDFCRQTLSRRVALRHDYPLYEFTVYVYRAADDPAAHDRPGGGLA
jgi:SAM-dependent methyltransferase